MPGSTVIRRADGTRAKDTHTERERKKERHDEAKGNVWRSSRVRRTERDRKPPGTSLGTGAMSHLSYYSHSPQPDLRQTNNLSPTAATVATSLLPFSVLLSARPLPPSLFHLALMGFVLVACACVCVYVHICTRHNTLPRRRQTVLFYNGTSHGSRLFM